MHWNDIEEIVRVLEENYPDEELDNLRFSYLEEMIRSLNEFEDHNVKVNKKVLEEILETWIELKKE
jgi:FeS assembly protein IscX